MRIRLIALVFLILFFIVSCQTAQTSDRKDALSDKDMKKDVQSQEKMDAVDVPSNGGDKVTVVEPAEKTSGQYVDIADFKFSPAKISIKKGTKVIWTNNDKAPHTVTADNINIGPNSGVLQQNEIYSYTFDKIGTFTYYCKIHPSMRATVEVVE